MKKKIVLIVSAFFLIFICSATVFATNNGITGFSDFFNKNLTIQKDEIIVVFQPDIRILQTRWIEMEYLN